MQIFFFHLGRIDSNDIRNGNTDTNKVYRAEAENNGFSRHEETFKKRDSDSTCEESARTISIHFKKSKPNKKRKMSFETKEQCRDVESDDTTTTDTNDSSKTDSTSAGNPALTVTSQLGTDASGIGTDVETSVKRKPYFRCSICDKSFQDIGRIKRHLKYHDKSNVSFQCEICNKSFRKSSRLRDHVNIHTGEKPYSCTSCGKSYFKKSSSWAHMKIKCGQSTEGNIIEGVQEKSKTTQGHSKVQCKLCSKWVAKYSMPKHLFYHSGVKPYECDICGMKFPIIGNLKRHLLSHEDKSTRESKLSYNFHCDKCKKSFYDKTHLDRHMTVHTGKKDFKCDVCGKSYPYKSGLTRHALTHNGGPKIECGICGKKFYDSSGLEIHLRLHTGMLDSDTKYLVSILIAEGKRLYHVQ